jgi:putative ABC transport system permease protein
MASEVALAIVLLTGAGVMLRSFAKVMAVDLGFDPGGVVTMEVSPVDSNPDILRQYYPALVGTLQEHPGIDAAGAVDFFPLGDSSVGTSATVAGRSFGPAVHEFLPGYFEATGFRLEAGRLPTAADRATGVPQALINASAARRVSGDVLGQDLVVWRRTYQIIGVVSDVRHSGPLGEARPEVYLSFGTPASGKWPLMAVVRSTLPRADLERVLRDAAAAPGPRVIVGPIRLGTDLLADRVATPRQRTVLLGLLGGLGLVLTLVGIFGTTAYAVGRRTQEIGVRMALGARPQQVVGAMLRDALWPALIGIVIGLGAASMATRVIESFLFETPPAHPATFSAVAVVMVVAAAVAAWIPARRAARVDPVEALRVG